jgi:hypothetical protein
MEFGIWTNEDLAQIPAHQIERGYPKAARQLGITFFFAFIRYIYVWMFLHFVS